MLTNGLSAMPRRLSRLPAAGSGVYDLALSGAGPVGSLTAILSRLRGASVLLVDRRGPQPTRQQLLKLDELAVRTLAEAGIDMDRLCRGATGMMSDGSAAVRTHVLEQALRSRAAEVGVHVLYRTVLADVEPGALPSLTLSGLDAPPPLSGKLQARIVGIAEGASARNGTVERLGIPVEADPHAARGAIALYRSPGAAPVLAYGRMGAQAPALTGDASAHTRRMYAARIGVENEGYLLVQGGRHPERVARALIEDEGAQVNEISTFEARAQIAQRSHLPGIVPIGDSAGNVLPFTGLNFSWAGVRDARHMAWTVGRLVEGADPLRAWGNMADSVRVRREKLLDEAGVIHSDGAWSELPDFADPRVTRRVHARAAQRTHTRESGPATHRD